MEQEVQRLQNSNSTDVNFEDETIEKDLEFESKYEPNLQENQENLLNIQHYYSNPVAFNEFVLHIHNQLDNDPLLETIRAYLHQSESQLLFRKQEEIKQLDTKLIEKEADSIISKGDLLGTSSFLSNFTQILQQRSTEFAKHYEQAKTQNTEIKKSIVDNQDRIQSLEKQIQSLYKRAPSKLYSSYNDRLKQESEKYDQTMQALAEIKQKNEMEKNQMTFLEEQYPLHLATQTTRKSYRDRIVEQFVLNLATKIDSEQKPQFELKGVAKYEIMDRVLPSRVYWIVAGIFIVIHVLWKGVIRQ